MPPENLIKIHKIEVGGFEGPLDLLLSLIEQRKLFINEISLAEVTNDYINYLKKIEHQNDNQKIIHISNFLIIASTLILIKSKSLLPNLSLTDDETEKIEDLENRLKLYKIIKEASIDIGNKFGTQIIFTSPERSYNEPIFSPDPQITILNISTSILNIVENLPKEKITLPEIEVKKVISMDQMINNLTERIEKSLSFSFSEFSKNHPNLNEKEIKVNVIVSFLAMLELVREGIIDVIQNNDFEDMMINKREEDEQRT